MATINIYDFDHTIYNGDCSLDFYLYCMRKKPYIVRRLPLQLWHAGLFILGRESRTLFKSNFFTFLADLGDISPYIDGFWDSNYRKVKDWYQEIDHSSDVIISASPDFLLQPVAKKLKVRALIATTMNSSNGTIDGNNCRGQEKVRRLRLEFPHAKVDSAYSDSMSDTPILNLAEKAFVVKGTSLIPLKDYQSMSGFSRWLTKLGARKP